MPMIKNINVLEAAIPSKKMIPKPMWLTEYANNLFVKISNDEYTGTGQVLTAALNLSFPYKYIIERLKKYLLGREEASVLDTNYFLRRLFFNGGYGITTGAIGGIDIALWDLYSQVSHKPLYKMLGGKNKKISRYVSLPRFSKVSDVVRIVHIIYNQGVRQIKLHQSAEDSIEAVKILHSEFPDLELMVDLSCTLSETKAKNFIQRVGNLELKYVEEPMYPPNDYKILKSFNRDVPIAAGENIFSIPEFQYCIENGIFTYFQPDVTKIGGISVGIEIIKLAEKYKAPISFHNRPNNGWIQILASAHLSSMYEGPCTVETPFDTIPKEYFNNNNQVNYNYIMLGGDGLGISLKENLPRKRRNKVLIP